MSVSIVKRNNVLAGFFVIASLLLAVGIAMVLGDVLGRIGATNEFSIRFPTTVGVTGLQPGSEVTFAGMPVGRVTAIRQHTPDGPGTPPEAMEVTIVVDKDLNLFENAFADLSPPILGGVSRINFASPGSGPVGTDEPLAALAFNNNNGVLDPGEAVRGRFAPSILAQLGFSVEDAERIRNSIADVEAITASAREAVQRFDRMAASLEPRFDGAVSDAQTAVANVRAMTDRLKDDGDWAAMVSGILTDAQRTAAEGPLLIEEARATVGSARSIIESRADSIERIISNIEATTERVRFETMDQAEELLREGTLAIASFRSVGERTDGMLAGMRPDIMAASANARSITHQGRLFLDEIRAQPWRLLKQPSREDMEREPLYAAARAYADAVANLRAASESLDAAVQTRGPEADAGPGRPPDEIARIADVVQAAYERFEVAERALLETLRAHTP